MSYTVLLPQPILPEGYAYLREHGCEIIDGRGFTKSDIIADIRDADAMIVRTAKITSKIFDAAPRLKIIARHGAGYDMVDIEAAKRNHVLVTTAGGANAISVAELTIFYMLHCSRRFKAVMSHCREDYRYAKMGIQKTELEGKTLGFIGTGHIGKLVAKKAAFGFNMRVLAYDPFARDVPAYIQMVEDRDEIFRQSDYVSLHSPLTEQTYHMIDEEKLHMMKPTAFLINTARGQLIDEKALIQALKEGVIAGAGLDVQEQEPPEEGSPLYTMDQVILTPHMGWRGLETRQRLVNLTAENIKAYLAGKPQNVIV